MSHTSSPFNKELFAALLEKAKGNRSLNAYAEAAGVSNAWVSRLLRQLVDKAPTAETIRKFADAAHNDVTYEALMEAAGHISADLAGKMERLEQLRKLQIEYAEAEASVHSANKQLDLAAQELVEAEKELEAVTTLHNAGAEYVTRFTRVPVLGCIAAGAPIFADDHIVDWEYYNNLGYPEGELFSLVVKGDSMIGSRIYEGDRVLVKVQPEVEDGEIAVVNVDGENATLKRVRKVDGRYMLYADNPNYPPIVVSSENARICGKVVRVIFDPNSQKI